MITIRLPRTDTATAFEITPDLRVVRVSSQFSETVIEIEAVVIDKTVSYVERALAEAGKRIHAIKLYRERTGVGLKDAKDAIDLAVPVPPRDW